MDPCRTFAVDAISGAFDIVCEAGRIQAHNSGNEFQLFWFPGISGRSR